MSTATGSNNTGHGHVYPRPDGVRARCGGPAMCVECSGDYVRQNSREAKHPMTDIDAIRKAKRYERYFDGMREERKGRYVTAIALDAALAAYDAKCEELAEMQKKVSRLESLYSVTAKLAADSHLKANALYVASEHGHNLLTPLGQQVLDDADATRAERDAAVRERDGLRDALTMAERVIRPLVESEFGQKWVWPVSAEEQMMRNARESLAAIDAQLAALAPPTEQPKVML